MEQSGHDSATRECRAWSAGRMAGAKRALRSQQAGASPRLERHWSNLRLTDHSQPERVPGGADGAGFFDVPLLRSLSCGPPRTTRETMPHMHAAAVIAPVLALFLALPTRAADAGCILPGAGVPARANTTEPTKPFYIDTHGLDLRTTPPTRDPSNPAYPPATPLADATLPSLGAEGNFVIGPTHTPAPETAARNDIPHGVVRSFTMISADSLIYRPGVVRDDAPGCKNAALNASATAPGDPSNVRVTASHAGNWTRQVDVYVPKGLRRDAPAPFIVFGDGSPSGFFREHMLFTILDAMIAERRLPPMVAIGIGAGGQDAQGSERGREYDAVNGLYAEWVEHEVLPRAERAAGVRLTRDPNDRVTMGFSSSGAAAFTMAWFHPELYRRVLAYSPTFTNQQWPHDPALPGGAWEYHDPWPGPKKPVLGVHSATPSPGVVVAGVPLVPSSPAKPIRFWFETGDHELFYYVPSMPDGMHDWTLADERMAAVLGDKHYHYQFVFARNAKHVDEAVEAQTLPEALVWVWRGYHHSRTR